MVNQCRFSHQILTSMSRCRFLEPVAQRNDDRSLPALRSLRAAQGSRLPLRLRRSCGGRSLRLATRNGLRFTRDQGSAFFCSNRYSNSGCGKTFSVFWDLSMPGCSLSTPGLFDFLTLFIETGIVAAAWRASRFCLSLSSAYRWRRAFHRKMTHFRSVMCREARPPPEDTSLTPESLTLRMFSEVSERKGCPFSYFQCHFQVALF